MSISHYGEYWWQWITRFSFYLKWQVLFKSEKLINQSLTLEEAAKVHDLPSSQADESQKSDDAEPLNALIGRFYIKRPSKKEVAFS